MSISSIPPSSPAPVSYPGAGTPPPPQAPAAASDGDANDPSSSQPVQPPLPPGQGTRVNQLA